MAPHWIQKPEPEELGHAGYEDTVATACEKAHFLEGKGSAQESAPTAEVLAASDSADVCVKADC